MLQGTSGTGTPNQPFGFLNIFSWVGRCWRGNVSYEGGMSLVWMNGLLLVPVVFAAFFYPLQALAFAAAMLAFTFVVYEGCVIWKKKHPAPSDAVKMPTPGPSA